MATEIIQYTGRLVVTSCWCGIRLGIPENLHRVTKQNGGTIYCPLGHQFVYDETMKKENERLRQQLETEKGSAQFWRDQEQATQRRLSATRGVLTKTKKRIASGKCPCCSKEFKNLAGHMERQHPGYGGEAG